MLIIRKCEFLIGMEYTSSNIEQFLSNYLINFFLGLLTIKKAKVEI